MNNIHKFFACLVRPPLIVKVLVGLAMTAVALNVIKPSDEQLHILIRNIGYASIANMICAFLFIRLFYADRHDTYFPNSGLHFYYLGSDSNFYHTIASSISLYRKFAGYIYALTKIVGSLGIGFLLMAGLYDIFTHPNIINH